ncbi:hypothetical protein CRYUN_Cryun21dG0041400 [Craigia yunnanensis]
MASSVERGRKSSRQPQPPPSSSSTPTLPRLELHANALLRILTMLSPVDAARFGKACSFLYQIYQAWQPHSIKTLSFKRHDSRYQCQKDKQRKMIKTRTTKKRANRGR